RQRFRREEHVIEPPPRDKSLEPCHQTKVRILLRILDRLNLAREFINRGERLTFAGDERIGLGKKFVFDTDGCNPALLQFFHEPSHVVEISVAGITVEQDWNVSGVAHEFDDFHYLRPARFIVVAYAECGGDRKPAGPDSAKAGFLDDAGTQRIVSLHQKLKTSGSQQRLELLRLTDFASRRGSHLAQQSKTRIIDFLSTQYQ